jgi:hypothetical protein
MNCIECNAPNPDENKYCGKCGAEIGKTVEQTIRRKFVNDREATEIQIAESVAARILKWSAVVGSLAILFIGKSCYDIKEATSMGKAQIAEATAQGKNEIEAARSQLSDLRNKAGELKTQFDQLQSDAAKYTQVTQRVEQLQREFNDAQGRWKDVDVTFHSVRLGGKGPLVLGIPATGIGSPTGIGCPTAIGGTNVIEFCVQGLPPMLSQVTHRSDKKDEPTDFRPVASLSTIGFRDASTEPKSNCSATSRGTFYVEKGGDKVADQPFLCVKRSNGTYVWIQLGAVQ